MSQKAARFEERQYMKKNTFEVFRYRDSDAREVALHHHDFYEVYFFLSGNVQYNIESRTYLLTPGDVLLISPMELHQPIFGPEQRDYERIVLWIDKRFLENFTLPGQDLAACFDTTAPGHANLLRPEGAIRQLLTFQLEQLLLESASPEAYSEISALSYLTQVLIILNRQAARAKQEESRVVPDLAVYNVLAYINEHYREDLSLDSLANRFFISKYHLSREFGRLVGTSVHRYIIQKRLIAAKQLMSEGMSSSLVYQHCGFGDYSNFYRAFKAEYEMSPREFALRLKKSSAADEFPPFFRERKEKA